MLSKTTYRTSDIRKEITTAVEKIIDPIRQTLSPKGADVIYEDNKGGINITNDGVTILKNLRFEDPIENAILEIVRHASLQTNNVAGDGTSGTVLYSVTLIKEGVRLVEGGLNRQDVKKAFSNFADQMVEQLQKLVRPVKTDNDLYYIAKVSAGGDEEIAKNVVKTVKTAGGDGMVFIEPSNQRETEIIEDTGFNINTGMFTPELRNNINGFTASYLNVPVLITDKRLYYSQEAETILSTVLKNGYREVVVIAKDFIGDALPYFVTNHTKGVMRVLLIKMPNVDADGGIRLQDLATYLGGQVISDKHGDIVDKLTIDDFVISTKTYADGQKTIISRDKEESSKDLAELIATLKKEIKKLGNKDTKELSDFKERVASLTNGIVTVKVGGNTAPETNEKIFRYEDAVNATREAMKSGYLIGGGISVLQAFRACKFKGDYASVFRKVGEASLRQIAENCGISGDIVMDTITQMDNPQFGFNALTGQYCDLLEAGVIDPFKVAEMTIRNAASVAGLIVGAGYLIVNNIKEDGESKN